MDTVWKLLAYIRARLGEPSSYPALFLVATGVLHWAVPPEQQTAFMAAGIIIAGMIGAILPDRFKKNTREEDQPKGDPSEDTLSPRPK